MFFGMALSPVCLIQWFCNGKNLGTEMFFKAINQLDKMEEDEQKS